MMFLQEAGAAASASGTMGFLTTVVPFLLIIAIFYFFLIRPQSKKQKETEKMLAALKKGDKVVTIGGIHGTISSTKEKSVIVKVDDNCKIEFSRSAIAGLDTPTSSANSSKDKGTDAKDAASNDASPKDSSSAASSADNNNGGKDE